MRKAIIFSFAAVFLALGCGEEEDLPDQILGSWECSMEELPTFPREYTEEYADEFGYSTSTITIDSQSTGWTLTFYMTGRFDSIIDIDIPEFSSFTGDQGISYSYYPPAPLVKAKITTQGRYEVYEDYIVFIPEHTNVYPEEQSVQQFAQEWNSDPRVSGDLVLDYDSWYAFLVEVLRPLESPAHQIHNQLTGSVKVSLTGDTLLLGGKVWSKM